VAAGVGQLVVGSAVFRPDGNYAAALAELAEGARRGSERGDG
jgi:ribulose-phosphate 3-epimerase